MSTCGYQTEGCFICWCVENKKECCFRNSEEGLKKCKCGNELPKNDYEFKNWKKLKKNG